MVRFSFQVVNPPKPQLNTIKYREINPYSFFFIILQKTTFCNCFNGSPKFFAFLWAYRSIGLCGSKRAKKLFRIAECDLFCNLIKAMLNCKKTARLFYYVHIIFLAHGVSAKKELRRVQPPLTSAVYYKQQFT